MHAYSVPSSEEKSTSATQASKKFSRLPAEFQLKGSHIETEAASTADCSMLENYRFCPTVHPLLSSQVRTECCKSHLPCRQSHQLLNKTNSSLSRKSLMASFQACRDRHHIHYHARHSYTEKQQLQNTASITTSPEISYLNATSQYPSVFLKRQVLKLWLTA